MERSIQNYNEMDVERDGELDGTDGWGERSEGGGESDKDREREKIEKESDAVLTLRQFCLLCVYICILDRHTKRLQTSLLVRRSALRHDVGAYCFLFTLLDRLRSGVETVHRNGMTSRWSGPGSVSW